MNRNRDTTGEAPAFLHGASEVAGLMRTQDGSATCLGHPATWPQSLKTVVEPMLNSKFPMFVAAKVGLHAGERLAQLAETGEQGA